MMLKNIRNALRQFKYKFLNQKVDLKATISEVLDTPLEELTKGSVLGVAILLAYYIFEDKPLNNEQLLEYLDKYEIEYGEGLLTKVLDIIMKNHFVNNNQLNLGNHTENSITWILVSGVIDGDYTCEFDKNANEYRYKLTDKGTEKAMRLIAGV